MKNLFTSLLLSGCIAPCMAQVTWTTPITVASGSTYGNMHPRIALNRSGTPYVLWGKSNTAAFLSKWNGSSFTSPVKPSGTLTIFAQSWAGPDLAAFGDTVYVSMKVTPETDTSNYCYLAHSYDGGVSFSTPRRIDTIGPDISRFPIVTTTPNGNPLVAFMKFDSGTMGNARYVVCRSSDFGNSFSADMLASSSSNPVCDCCPAAIISTSSNAIMLYRDNASNIRDIWAAVSSDGGATFPSRLNVDNHSWMYMSCPSSGPDGIVMGDTLYTVYRTSAGGSTKVYLSKTSVSALSVGSSTAITSSFSGLTWQDFPRIANSGNAAIAVWVQSTSSGKYIAYSFTNNITGGLAGYNTVTGATGSVMNADVVMQNGDIHVVWEDMGSGDVKYMKGTYPVTTSAATTSKEQIEVFPNPATSAFTVRLDNGMPTGSSYLSDMTGRRIDMLPVSVSAGRAVYSTDGLPKGNYYFVIEGNDGKTWYSKLLLQ